MDIQTIRKARNEVDEKLGLIPKLHQNADDQEIMDYLKQVAEMHYLHRAGLSFIALAVLMALEDGAVLNGNNLELPKNKIKT